MPAANVLQVVVVTTTAMHYWIEAKRVSVKWQSVTGCVLCTRSSSESFAEQNMLVYIIISDWYGYANNSLHLTEAGIDNTSLFNLPETPPADRQASN